MSVEFKRIFDSRFEGRNLLEASINGDMTINQVQEIVNNISERLISGGKNSGVHVGVAYHYEGFGWIPAMITDISKRQKINDFHVPLFIETDSGQELQEKVGDEDGIDKIKIYVLTSGSMPDTKDLYYKRPNSEKGLSRSIFDRVNEVVDEIVEDVEEEKAPKKRSKKRT